MTSSSAKQPSASRLSFCFTSQRAGAIPLIASLAGLLSENNRLSELSKIVGKFEEITADQRGEVKATVTTAEASAGQRQRGLLDG